jgi:CRISPR-associated endonuclease/helicase Cas3
VHTYDAFQAQLLAELLTWLGATNTPVTILSASLPEHRLNEYTFAYGAVPPMKAIYPGVTSVTPISDTLVDGKRVFEVTQVPVEARRVFNLDFTIHETRADALIEKHVALAQRYRHASESARIAVVVNQVDRAIEIGHRLEELGHAVVVFHSRMTAGHRKEISEKLIELCGKDSLTGGVTVVGTQVIEASLDVDFDCMVTDLAPAPSLIQRAGRLWRHSQPTDGVWEHTRPRKGLNPMLDIVVAMDQNAASGLSPIARYPYLMVELKRTLEAFLKLGSPISIPGDVQKLVDAAAVTSEQALAAIDAVLDATTQANVAVTDEDLNDAYFQELRRNRNAGNIVIPFRGKGHSKPVLAPDLNFLTLSETTNRHEVDDASTRFIEQDQRTFLLIDPTGRTPYAWKGTAEQAAAVTGGEAAKDLLRSTFNLTMKKFRKMSGLVQQATDEEWNPRTPAFRGVIPVRLERPSDYSALLGLTEGY